MSNTNLPKLSDLHHAPEEAFKTDQLSLLLNQPPHASWVKKHPMYGNKYLPIDKIEFLLTRIFQQWRVEVLSTTAVFNSILVTVRLHYRNPVTGEWSWHDGVGAKDLQLDSGAKPSDLSAIKGNAVMLAAPIAKSLAIKDATDHLGALFGRDLNRKDTLMFSGSYEKPEQAEPVAASAAASTNSDNFEL